MGKLIGSAAHVFPKAYCRFCAARTPHRHERVAINRRQVARAVCLTCNKERPGEESSESSAMAGGSESA